MSTLSKTKVACFLQRMLGAALFLLTISLGSMALAQDEEDGDDENPQPVGQVVRFADENFDQWIFQPVGNAAAGRKKIESRLLLQLAEIDRNCKLSETQKEKLQLAARGDVKRFFDQVEQGRKKFKAIKDDQNKFNEVWQDIQPLNTKFTAGLFEEGSLFRKVLQRTLSAEQIANYKNLEMERRRFRYRASIASAVMTIENAVPLRDEQRQKLLKLLQAETRPPLKFGQYDYYMVVYQMSRIPEDRLKPLFDEIQWRGISRQFQQVQGMVPFLKQNAGFLPDDVEADAADEDAKAGLNKNQKE